MRAMNLHDRLNITTLRGELTAPITNHPQVHVHIHDDGYSIIEPSVIDYPEYATSQGVDSTDPLTVIRSTSFVQSDRVLKELESIEPELEHLTQRVSSIKEELTTAKAEYRAYTKDGTFPQEPSKKKEKKIIPIFVHRLRRQTLFRWIQYKGLIIISIIEGSSFFPVLLSQYGIDPSNLGFAISTALPMVIMSILFTLTIALCLFFLGKEVVSRTHYFFMQVRTDNRIEKIISGIGVMTWCLMYFLFISALALLRSSFTEDVMAMTEHAPETSLSFLYYVITATIPLVCGLLASRITPLNANLITAKETWEKSRDEAQVTQETNRLRKHHHEAYTALLQEAHDQASQELNTLIARKNSLLDIAEQAETKFRASFTQDRDSTVRFSRSLHLALEEAKHTFIQEQDSLHLTRIETTTTARRQSSMARIIELAKAHS